MTHLTDHARAARIFGDAFEEQATLRIDTDSAQLLMSIATAYRHAALVMETEARAAIVDHGCTLDHRTIPAGKRCGSCGAPRG